VVDGKDDGELVGFELSREEGYDGDDDTLLVG